WPGNVRELENLIHREFLLTDESDLRLASLPRAGRGPVQERRIARRRRTDPPVEEIDAPPRPPLTEVAFREAKAHAIAAFDREYVGGLLVRAGGNVSLAARLAGKERSRLNRLLRKHRISAQEFKIA